MQSAFIHSINTHVVYDVCIPWVGYRREREKVPGVSHWSPFLERKLSWVEFFLRKLCSGEIFLKWSLDRSKTLVAMFRKLLVQHGLFYRSVFTDETAGFVCGSRLGHMNGVGLGWTGWGGAWWAGPTGSALAGSSGGGCRCAPGCFLCP